MTPFFPVLVVLARFVKKDFPFIRQIILSPLLKINRTYMYLFLDYPFRLVDICICLYPIPWSLRSWSFIAHLEIRHCESSNSILLQSRFAYFRLFAFYTDFRASLSNSIRKKKSLLGFLDFDCDHVNSGRLIWGNLHVDSIGLSIWDLFDSFIEISLLPTWWPKSGIPNPHGPVNSLLETGSHSRKQASKASSVSAAAPQH